MKDSFKPLFCASSFYTNYQDSFKVIDDSVNQLCWDKTSEVMLWTTMLCLLRRPKDWFGAINSSMTEIMSDSDANFSVYELTQKLKIDWPQKISQQISFSNFLRTIKIKPLPEAAQRAMYFIFTKKYPITVLDYEPSPTELLQIQCEGRRIITFKNDYTFWPTQLFGKRDPLSFWLHDCIHAEHYFSKPETFLSQLGFYKFVAQAYKAKCWPESIDNQSFESDFSYLISDMNSHPLHLFKTLKAITDIHFKADSLGIWEKVIQTPPSSPEELDALRKLNTAYFVDKDCDALLRLTKRLGAQSYST